MKASRIALRGGVIGVVVALMSTLLAVFAHAQGTYSLVVQIPEGHRVPHSFVVWQVPASADLTAQLAELAVLTDKDIAAAHPESVRLVQAADAHGTATFTGLPAGRYYVRAAHADGVSTTDIATPLLVDLPQPGQVGPSLTVYPKPTPEEPGSPSTPPGEPGVPPSPSPSPFPPTPLGPTGGERFLKVDKEGTPLAEAAFAVQQKTQSGYQRVTRNGQPLVVTSASDGTFNVTGLAYGVYQLKETTAPKGFKLLTEVIPFTVNADSLDDGVVIRIVNVPAPPGTIPKTGDISLLLSLAAGAILIGMGTYLARKPRATATE